MADLGSKNTVGVWVGLISVHTGSPCIMPDLTTSNINAILRVSLPGPHENPGVHLCPGSPKSANFVESRTLCTHCWHGFALEKSDPIDPMWCIHREYRHIQYTHTHIYIYIYTYVYICISPHMGDTDTVARPTGCWHIATSRVMPLQHITALFQHPQQEGDFPVSLRPVRIPEARQRCWPQLDHELHII